MPTKDAVKGLLNWDFFLDEKDREEGAMPREHILAWRKREWSGIVRVLRNEYGLEVPEGQEPHWVEPARAVFWTQDVILKPVKKAGVPRHNLQKIDEEKTDWLPTSGLPVGNANQLHYYLEKKGFRLRPPLDGVDGQLKEVVESALTQEVPEQEKKFLCKNHNMRMVNWRAYTMHCERYQEMPDLEQLPDEMAEVARSWDFYCIAHRYGTNVERAAINHRRLHMGKPSAGRHISIENMRMKKPVTAGNGG